MWHRGVSLPDATQMKKIWMKGTKMMNIIFRPTTTTMLEWTRRKTLTQNLLEENTRQEKVVKILTIYHREKGSAVRTN